MKISISPCDYIEGKITANPSKSYMQRVIAVSSLAEGPVNIVNYDLSEDSRAALSIAEALGSHISYVGEIMVINPGIKKVDQVWNAGESGLSARMFGAIAGLFEEEITITGSGSLMKRPMNSLIESLSNAGLKIAHNNNKLPLTISGKYDKGEIHIDMGDGSQVLSGLLIALCKCDFDSRIEVAYLNSKPYIDLTIYILQLFGAKVINNGYKEFLIRGNQNFSLGSIAVEGDWSGAAFHMVAAAINGKVAFGNLNLHSRQGDRIILDILKNSGAAVSVDSDMITVEKRELLPFKFDATDTPDLIPPLAVLGANCTGKCMIKGISRLESKESNRFNALKTEFEKLGLKIKSEGDWLITYPGKPKGGNVNSHNDHRIAMALATLALNSKEPVILENAECVRKSYPGFFGDLELLGIRITNF
jgi:3-phosphoshikimate 1-carboxyvinyltransferase